MSRFLMEDDLYRVDRPFDDRRAVYDEDRQDFRHEDFVERDMLREPDYHDRRDMLREPDYHDRRDMYLRREELIEGDELDRVYDRMYDEDYEDRVRQVMQERDRQEERDRLERAYYEEIVETRRMELEREDLLREREREISQIEDFEMAERHQESLETRYSRDRRGQGRRQDDGRGRGRQGEGSGRGRQGEGRGRGRQGEGRGRGRQGDGRGREGRGYQGGREIVSRDRSPRGEIDLPGNRNRRGQIKERPSRAHSVHSHEGSVRSMERSPARSVTKIHRLLHLCHSKVREVRIIHSSFGDSKRGGCGFVDFVHNPDAKLWMEKTQNHVEIKGKKVTLAYGIPNKRTNWVKGDHGWLKWVTHVPSSNILIWNIDRSLEATQIEVVLNEETENLVCCKIIRSVGSGESRGFGFLEFKDQASAEKWFNESKGMILMSENSLPIFATYSSGTQNTRKPWVCNKCGTENYKHREHCFTCKLSKTDSEKIISYDGSEEVGTNPCNTLVFQGLDALTCEDSLNNALYWATGVYCRQVIVMRDPLTNVSMSYAFGEMTSVQEAKDVMETLASVLEVDGKQVTVSFTKNTFNTIITTFTYSGQEPLQPVIFTPEEFQQNQSEAVAMEMEALADAEDLADEEFIPPKVKESKTKPPPSSENEEKPDTSYVDPLNMELEVINRFLLDPRTGKYYNNFTKMQCPVKDCKVQTKWETLRTHWRRAHVPTKTGYMCQVGPCKKKKIVHKTVALLHEHFKTHPALKEKNYEDQTKRAKKVPVPNINCVDPGNAVLPMPKLTGGPKVELPEQKCPVESCPHSYTTLEKMQQHWSQYHNTRVAMYRCCECDTMNRDKHFMKTHMKVNHKANSSALEKVMLDNKQLIEPGNVVPFWSLYRDDEDDDLFEEENEKKLEERLGDDFPLVSVPCPGNDPEDLAEFISWTQRYMNRLQVVSVDAMRDLKKLAKRKMEQ